MGKISNWRYDLREVEGVPEDISNSKPTTDLKSKREVTEKPVNNKVTINPPLGDKMESVIASMGGKLISISEEGKCDDCICKGCGPGGVGHKIPCAKCGGTHKEEINKDVREGSDAELRAKEDRGRDLARKAEKDWEKANSTKEDRGRDLARKAEADAKKRGLKVTNEATYPGHDEKGNPLKPKDNRYRVSNADKKANTPAWQKYKSGDKKYTKFDHVDEKKEHTESYESKKTSEVIKALTKKKDSFKKRYGKDAPDVMYAVAAKTAKKKGDTSKSDDKYAYEEYKVSEGVLGSPGAKKLRSASDRSKNSMTDKDRKKQENIRKGRDILTDIQGTQKALDHEVGLDRRIARSKIKKEEYKDKALSNTIDSIRKGGGVMASDIPKATDDQKAEWKAERARRAASRKPADNPYKPRAGESD
jgi:hypothetical protein